MGEGYTPSAEAVEHLASALYGADSLYPCSWEENREDVRDRYRRMARAGLRRWFEIFRTDARIEGES